MKTRFVPILICIVSLLILTSGGSAAPGATPLGTAFTYQGRLDRAGAPYTGSCDFLFSLFDAETEGFEIGETVAFSGLAVTGGLFTARLDFGAGAFNGDARWLELNVQCPDDVSSTTFPRQELTATPYAMYAAAAPWSGLTGVPAGLDDGDDDTLYSAGEGLVLSTTTFSIDPAVTQRRVDELCAVGSTITSIHEDGSVDCEIDDLNNRAKPPTGPGFFTLDSDGDVGKFTSITIGTDGLGLISYYDQTNGNLKVAHCIDTACSSATIATISDGNDIGQYSSIAIGKDGLGLISFYNATKTSLGVAHCNDLACTSADIYTLDETGEAGQYTAITIGSNGLGVISYYDQLNMDLKVANCIDVNCSGADVYTLYPDNDSGKYSSIAVNARGEVLIAFESGIDLLVASCYSPCMGASISSTSTFTIGTSITIGEDGLGLIVNDAGGYHVEVIHCEDYSCSTSVINTIATNFTPEYFYPSITIGPDGLGMISYSDTYTDSLIVATCRDSVCSKVTSLLYRYLAPINGAYYTSITIGADDYALISCYDDSLRDLEAVHCTNEFCNPYFRRR